MEVGCSSRATPEPLPDQEGAHTVQGGARTGKGGAQTGSPKKVG